MKIKIILFPIIFLFQLSISFACSCGPLYFCDFIKQEDVIVAVQAKLLKKDWYGNQNIASYFEIIDTYKDEIGLSDTLKLYGNVGEASCDINVHNLGNIGDTIIFAISELYLGTIFNPKADQENYSEFKPSLCYFSHLRLSNNILIGRITDEILEYTYDGFKERLSNCDFPKEDLIEEQCGTDNLFIFPNPANGGRLWVLGDFRFNPIESIKIYSPNGQLIAYNIDSQETAFRRIDIHDLVDGLYYVEIYCSRVRHIRKLVVRQ